MKSPWYQFAKPVLLISVLLFQPPALWAVDESSLPVIPDTGNFDPAKVNAIPIPGGTRSFGGTPAMKRLPPAPTTKAEIIRLMKKPKSKGPSRAFGGKSPSPKARVHLYFALNSARIQDYSILNEWGAALQSQELAAAKTIKIEGHTDSTGSDESNMSLSELRALAVKTYLLREFGLDPSLFQIVPYGESLPYASNSTEAGRSLNRRVEIVLSYPSVMMGNSGGGTAPPAVADEPYYEE